MSAGAVRKAFSGVPQPVSFRRIVLSANEDVFFSVSAFYTYNYTHRGFIRKSEVSISRVRGWDRPWRGWGWPRRSERARAAVGSRVVYHNNIASAPLRFRTRVVCININTVEIKSTRPRPKSTMARTRRRPGTRKFRVTFFSGEIKFERFKTISRGVPEIYFGV